MAITGNYSGSSLLDNFAGKNETAYLVVHDTRSAIKGDKIFPVQFNPAQIQVYASCAPVFKANTAPSQEGANTPRSAVDVPTHPNFEMTLQLFFDAVFPADSFMWEKFTTGVSTQTAKTIAAAATKKVYSVQPQIEALIAILRDPNTRSVTFHWADFEFSGQVKQIMAKYTMFSVSGRPVRGVVTLRLRQSVKDNNVAQANWKADFQKAFGGAPSNSSLVRPGQKGGSLINFNF